MREDAVTFKTAIDEPGRFRHSKEVGPHLGLTPRKHQSGETDLPKRAAFAAGTGQSSKVGDAMARTALYKAVTVLLSRVACFSAL